MGLRDAIEDVAREPAPTPESNRPDYFSTGPSPITAPEEWRRVDFGNYVSRITIRDVSDDIVISFVKPWDNPRAHINLERAKTPYTLGDGDDPIDSDVMWIRRDPSVNSDVDVEINALG